MHDLMNTKDSGKQVAGRRHLFTDLFIAKARLARLSAYSPICIKGSGITATPYASRLHLFTALNSCPVQLYHIYDRLLIRMHRFYGIDGFVQPLAGNSHLYL